MKEKQIGISKIVINIGDKEAALTVEQAKGLRDALNALFGEKVIEKVVERERWYPYTPYIYTPHWTVTVGDQPQIIGTITTATTNTNTAGFTVYLTSSDGDLLPV